MSNRLNIGETVAGMEIVGTLGKGAFGEVYSVRVPGHGVPCALKVMNLSPEIDQSLRLRFQREAEILRTLDSDRVPKIYQLGALDDGSPFILMEVLHGRTLSELLKDGGTLPWQQVVELGIQACEALAVAHAAGVLHRDLKPSNFFVTDDEAGKRLKILDFGVATFVSGSTDRYGALTKTNAIVGTPHYMSPEQVRAAAVGPESDLYMLGVVLYELLSGERPFAGENLGELLGAVLSSNYTPIAVKVSKLPPYLSAAIDRAMSLSPLNRFSSAAEMAQALNPELAPMHVPAAKETVPSMVRRPDVKQAPRRPARKREDAVESPEGTSSASTTTKLGSTTIRLPLVSRRWVWLGAAAIAIGVTVGVFGGGWLGRLSDGAENEIPHNATGAMTTVQPAIEQPVPEARDLAAPQDPAPLPVGVAPPSEPPPTELRPRARSREPADPSPRDPTSRTNMEAATDPIPFSDGPRIQEILDPFDD